MHVATMKIISYEIHKSQRGPFYDIYLGSLVTGENSVSEEITNRLIAANSSYFRLKSMFNPLNAQLNTICHPLALLGAHHIFHVSGLRVKSQLLSRKTKSLICKTHVWPIPTQAAEIWTTTKNDERRLYFRKENPSQNVWSNTRERAMAEEIQQRLRRAEE